MTTKPADLDEIERLYRNTMDAENSRLNCEHEWGLSGFKQAADRAEAAFLSAIRDSYGSYVDADFARTLERELAAMRAERDALLAQLDEASPKRKCDRCGKEFRMHQLIYEEGDEMCASTWQCGQCNDRENARERAALAAQEKP